MVVSLKAYPHIDLTGVNPLILCLNYANQMDLHVTNNTTNNLSLYSKEIYLFDDESAFVQKPSNIAWWNRTIIQHQSQSNRSEPLSNLSY